MFVIRFSSSTEQSTASRLLKRHRRRRKQRPRLERVWNTHMITFNRQISHLVTLQTSDFFLFRTEIMMFWRMLVTKQLVPIYIHWIFHIMYLKWKSVGTEAVWLPTFFKISYFKFNRRKLYWFETINGVNDERNWMIGWTVPLSFW